MKYMNNERNIYTTKLNFKVLNNLRMSLKIVIHDNFGNNNDF